MTKTIKTVLAVIGALTAICGVLLLLKKLGLIKVCCKKCGKEKCECDKPETVEDFVEEAVEDKVKEVKEAVEEKVEEAKEKAEAIAEEFKDYADVELPKE